MSMLVFENVSVVLGGRRVIDNISFESHAGLTVLLGRNGSGKSTLMRAVMGIVPYSGRIYLGGKDIAGTNVRERARLFSWLGQEQSAGVSMTVREYAALGATPAAGIIAPTGKNALVQADAALAELEISHLSMRAMDKISGGEARLAALARARVQKSEYLLLDEPLSHLDYVRQHEYLEALRARRASALISVHDPALAWQYGDRVVLIDGGKLATIGEKGAENAFEPQLKRVYGDNMRFIAADGIVIPVRTAKTKEQI